MQKLFKAACVIDCLEILIKCSRIYIIHLKNFAPKEYRNITWNNLCSHLLVPVCQGHHDVKGSQEQHKMIK